MLVGTRIGVILVSFVFGMSVGVAYAQVSSAPVVEVEDGDQAVDLTPKPLGVVTPATTPAAPKEISPGYLRFEHHGMFRLRPDLMYRLHLGTSDIVGGHTVGTSAVLPPTTDNVINSTSGGNPFSDQVGPTDNDARTGVNFRFRYRPALYVGEHLKLVGGFDLFDNFVLGSTPAAGAGDPRQPLAVLSGGQQTLVAGENGWRDALRTRELFLTLQHGIGSLRIGRQAHHWGMGLVYNSGNKFNSDFGDVEDRLVLEASIPGLGYHLALGYNYDWLMDDLDWFGASTSGDQAAELLGQGDTDYRKGYQLTASLTNRPHDWSAPRVLVGTRTPRFDWGLMYTYRSWELDSAGTSVAQVHIPDVWGRLDWNTAGTDLFTIEFEAAYVFGSIAPGVSGGSNLELGQLGFAMTSSYSLLNRSLTIGLDAGLATGDPDQSFGYSPFHQGATTETPDSTLAAFHFDRDFRVDQILFYEVVGGISNAWYAKPWVQYDFEPDLTRTRGIRIGLEGAFAMESTSTPGQSDFLGFEVDIEGLFEEVGRYRWGVSMGFLFPGAAFNLLAANSSGSNDKEADWAMRVQGFLGWVF